MYMEHNANTANESQNTIFISFASNIVNANDIAQIANSGVRFIRLNYLIIIVDSAGVEPASRIIVAPHRSFSHETQPPVCPHHVRYGTCHLLLIPKRCTIFTDRTSHIAQTHKHK